MGRVTALGRSTLTGSCFRSLRVHDERTTSDGVSGRSLVLEGEVIGGDHQYILSPLSAAVWAGDKTSTASLAVPAPRLGPFGSTAWYPGMRWRFWRRVRRSSRTRPTRISRIRWETSRLSGGEVSGAACLDQSARDVGEVFYTSD